MLPRLQTRWKLANNDFPKIWSILSGNEKQLLAEATQEQQQHGDTDNELTPLETLALGLGDTGLITGLAIILSSMAKAYADPQYPQYHLFIARMLASLAFCGYNASNVVYPKLRTPQRRNSLYTRWFLSTSAMVLFLHWNTAALSRFKDWQYYTPGCFSGHRNRGYGTYGFWILVHYFWIPQMFGWVLLVPFSFVDELDSVAVRIDVLTLFLIRSAWWRIRNVGMVPSQRRRDHSSWWRVPLDLLGNALWAVIMTGVVVLYLTLALFLFPVDSLGPVSNLFLGIVWATYDLVTIKMSNLTAVVYSLQMPGPVDVRNPETEWGIGQIFPLVMGLQVALACLDALFDSYAGEFWFLPLDLGVFFGSMLMLEAESEKPQKKTSTAVASTANTGHAESTATVSSNVTPVARKRTVPQQVQAAHVHG